MVKARRLGFFKTHSVVDRARAEHSRAGGLRVAERGSLDNDSIVINPPVPGTRNVPRPPVRANYKRDLPGECALLSEGRALGGLQATARSPSHHLNPLILWRSPKPS